MNKNIIPIILLVFALFSCKESDSEKLAKSIKFDSLIYKIKHQSYFNDTFKLPVLYQNNEFKIQISKNPIPFIITEIQADNPFKNNIPISYNVIYNNTLIALFDNGLFLCYTIPSMERNYKFERIINTKKFQYQWVFDKKLIAISNGIYYYLNSKNNWEEYKEPIPFKMQPILFEDEKYIVFSSCFGEWGGLVYFCNKFTKDIHCAEATCANTIFKRNNSYFVLSFLAHECGASEYYEIINPDSLPIIKSNDLYKNISREIFLLTYPVNFIKKIMPAKRNIAILSSFIYHDKTLFVVNWNHQTFLAEYNNNNTFSIVNPLFNQNNFCEQQITTKYENTILINYWFWGFRQENKQYKQIEGALCCMIIQDNRIINFRW